MFKIVNKARYNLLERIAERTDNYLNQIKNDFEKIDSLNNKIEELENTIKIIINLFQEKRIKEEKMPVKLEDCKLV